MFDTLTLRGTATPARLAASLTILVAMIALSGWVLDIRPLSSILPGAVAMKVNTAIALISSGISLLIVSDPPIARLERCAQVLAAGVALVGLATLGEYLFGWNLGFDELIYRDGTHTYNIFHGRMSPLSALAFTALGVALAVMRYPPLRRVASAGAWFAAAAAALSLLGYLWYAGELVTDAWLPPVALNTACCFLLLGVGILFSLRGSRTGITEELTALPSVEKKTLIGFITGFCLLLIGGGLTYRATVDFATSSGRVARSQEVRASLADVYGSLAGAELAERDYLLTGSPARLEDYRRLKVEVDLRLALLRRLTSDSAVQQKNVSELGSLISGRLDDVARSLDAFERSGLAAARAALAQGSGHDNAEQIRRQIEVMDGVEAGYLATGELAAVKVRATTLVSLLVTLAVAASVFIALFGGIHREMRARQRSDKELLDANRFLDSLVENLPVMVVLKDAKTLRFVRLNQAFERFMGVQREDLIGKTAHQLFTAEEADAMAATDRQAVAAAGPVEGLEQSISTPHLGYRTLHTMKMAIMGQDGKAQYLLAIGVDITQRKLSEQAVCELNTTLEAKAAQLQTTNQELESFSYSVSHDLRAPLRSIDGFALMLEEDYRDTLDSEGRRFLGVIRQASRRMGELIDDLLAFSRLGRQPIVPRRVDMSDMVKGVMEEALHLHDGARPEVVLGELPPAEGDAVLLRQVWTNLLSNAVKYSGKSERPRIQIDAVRGRDEICYSVRDNGVGFDMRYADKLFGVFQRLHRHDEFSGTGVGLAIVQRIVVKHGGRVWARGVLGEGAEFSFSLPARSRLSQVAHSVRPIDRAGDGG